MKSSPNNRINAILDALTEAHGDAQTQSRTSLNRMPESFMAVRVADYFAEHFSNFGYRLEAQVKRTFEASEILADDFDELLAEPDLRADGRFDLVLHTRKTWKTAHIIEFKRGDAMRGLISDIKRLAKVCAHAKRHSLQTNYLVLTRRCPAEKDTSDRMLERLSEALDADGLGDTEINVVFSEPLTPYLNRDHLCIESAAFQVVVLELKG